MARRDSDKLLDQVASLCEQIKDTRELTRAVANLLFQEGERPTASRVLQLTRRGSMVTLNDEMAKWWDELRAKLDVRLVNPNIPAALLEKQGNLLGEIWDMAMSQARAEMQVYREEADQKVANAEAVRSVAESFAEEQRQAAESAHARREETEQLLAAEHSARISAEGEAEHWRTQAESSALALERSRADFTTQMDAQRAALERAEQQFNDMRRQNLLEIDSLRTSNTEVRQALKKAEHQIARLEESERNLQESERALHDQVTARDASIARLTGETSALSARLESAIAERDGLTQARAGDREAHREAIAGRDALIGHLQEAAQSMKRTESLLNDEVGRLKLDNIRQADEIAQLKIGLKQAGTSTAPHEGGPDKQGT